MHGSVRVKLAFLILLLGPALSAVAQTDLVSRRISERVSEDLFRPKLKIGNGAGAIVQVSAGAAQGLLTLVMEDGTVRLWDLGVGAQLAIIPGPGAPVSVAAPASEGRAVILGDRVGGVFVADLEAGGRPVPLGSHERAVTRLAISREGRSVVTGSDSGQAIVWDLDARKQRAVLSADDAAAITAIAISADGSRVATGADDGSLRVWSVDTGEVMASLDGISGAVLAVQFSEDGESAVVGTSKGAIETIEIASGKRLRRLDAPGRKLTQLAISRSGDRAALGYSSGKLRVFDLVQGRKLRQLEHEEGGVGPLSFLSGGQHLLSSGADGIARIWDLKTGESLLRLIGTARGWAVIGRHGRFDGSEQGIDDVSWQTRAEDLSLDRFSESYFEPGLLASYLQDGGEFVVPDPVTIEDGIDLPPLVLIASVEPAADGKLVVVVTAEDRGGGIETIRLYHNGKLVPSSAVIAEEDVRGEKQHVRAMGFAIDQLPGPNSFKAIATGKLGIESESQRLTKLLEGPTPPSTLHIAAVGLNVYRDPKMALDFSVPDAEAIASRLGATGEGSFADVREHRLLDERATRSGILDLLASFRETAPADVVVVYLAGHGTAIGDEWYFLPYAASYDSDASKLTSTGVSATEIQEALVSARAQRVLLMIDSCYSGTGVMTFQKLRHFQRRFLRSLSRIAGVTVLAATREDQLAFERSELGHGIFTYAVLNGLGGEADSRPRDGRITAHELVGHSLVSLPALSRRFFPRRAPQEPMAFALGADFLLRTLR